MSLITCICCHREEWVSVVVQEGVQRVFSSFAEALRREAMKVSQSGGGPRTVGGIYFLYVQLFAKIFNLCMLDTCAINSVNNRYLN